MLVTQNLKPLAVPFVGGKNRTRGADTWQLDPDHEGQLRLESIGRSAGGRPHGSNWEFHPRLRRAFDRQIPSYRATECTVNPIRQYRRL